MDGTRPKALAVVAGFAVGLAVFLLTRTALEPGRALFAAGQNALVWSIAVGVYLSVADRVPRDEGGPFRSLDEAKWDAFVGLLASVAAGGVVFLLPTDASVQYAVGMTAFVLGACFAFFAAGVELAIHHVDRFGGSDIDPNGAVHADD